MPSGYTLLEEGLTGSGGSITVSRSIYNNGTHGVYLDFKLNGSSNFTGANYLVYGDNLGSWQVRTDTSGNLVCNTGFNGTYTLKVPAGAYTTRRQLTYAPQYAVLGDVGYPATIYTNGVLGLFGTLYTSGMTSSYALYTVDMTLYRCIVFDAFGEYMFDLIPCIRNSDGAKGVYDVVGKVFYLFRVFNRIVYSNYQLKFEYPVATAIDVTYDAYWNQGGYYITETVTVAKGRQIIDMRSGTNLPRSTTLSVTEDINYYYIRYQ